MKTSRKYIADPVERTKQAITAICTECEYADITIEMDNYCHYFYLYGTPGFSHKFVDNVLIIDTPRGRNTIDMAHVFSVRH